MVQNLMMLGSMARLKLRQLFSDEKGEVNIVAIVVLIGIAVLLALIFKDEIERLLRELFKTIDKSAKSAIANSNVTGE